MCALYRFRKVGRGCLFATFYISSFSSVLSRSNCAMDKFTLLTIQNAYAAVYLPVA